MNTNTEKRAVMPNEEDTTATGGDAGATDAPAPAADALTEKFTELGVTDEVATAVRELGVNDVAGLGFLTEDDLIDAGMAPIPARQMLAALKPAPPEPTMPDAAALSVAYDVLPSVPDDASWLNSLRTGGVLKVDTSTVIGAVRAALASRVSLYDIPARLVDAMEAFADETEEQVPAEFYKLRKQLTRRNYGEIFEAIDGLDGNFVTETRRKELIRRIDDNLWPVIASFHSQLQSWQEQWVQGAANPAVMMAALMGGGGMAGVMPPGMMQPPDTAVLRDHASAVNDAVNSIFKGTGVQIAAALAYDAAKVRESLEDPRLPAMIGAANREQMLKKLGVAVNATYPRLEQNITKFVLATMRADEQPAGEEELRYFSALVMLGSQISWDQLGVSRRGRLSGIGAGDQL